MPNANIDEVAIALKAIAAEYREETAAEDDRLGLNERAEDLHAYDMARQLANRFARMKWRECVDRATDIGATHDEFVAAVYPPIPPKCPTLT